MALGFQDPRWEGPSILRTLRTFIFCETAGSSNHEGKIPGHLREKEAVQNNFLFKFLMIFPLPMSQLHPRVTCPSLVSSLCLIWPRVRYSWMLLPSCWRNLVALTASCAARQPSACSWSSARWRVMQMKQPPACVRQAQR